MAGPYALWRTPDASGERPDRPASGALKPQPPGGTSAAVPAGPRGWDVSDLYQRFGPLVLRRCRRFLSPGDAEEVAHEVFVKALEHAERFRDESSPATWLFRVATRLSLNHLRDRRRQGALLTRHAPTVFPESTLATAPEARIFLASLWRTLDDELALIGVLYYLDGLTTAEIGRTLGVSDRTIANRLRSLEDVARRSAGEGSP